MILGLWERYRRQLALYQRVVEEDRGSSVYCGVRKHMTMSAV